MEELIQHLEKQIKKLIDQHNQLKQSNQKLQQSKVVLLAKQQKAITQIETLVSRLKAIEKLS